MKLLYLLPGCCLLATQLFRMRTQTCWMPAVHVIDKDGKTLDRGRQSILLRKKLHLRTSGENPSVRRFRQ